MSSVTITDIPEGVDIPQTMTYNDFVEHTLKEYDDFDPDLRFTDYEDLSPAEQKELDYYASLPESEFVNI